MVFQFGIFLIFLQEVKTISIIIVKKEANKIVIGSDSQETFGDGYQINMSKSKLKEVSKDIYVASVGDANLASLFYSYLEKNTLDSIQTSIDVVEFFREFNEWCLRYIEPSGDKDSLLSLCQFLLVIKDSVWFFSNFYTRKLETEEYYAIGAGSQAAFACMHVGATVEDSLKAVCRVDIYCSEPLEVYEIKNKWKN